MGAKQRPSGVLAAYLATEEARRLESWQRRLLVLLDRMSPQHLTETYAVIGAALASKSPADERRVKALLRQHRAAARSFRDRR